jgi:biopolymer transport protein ExbD
MAMAVGGGEEGDPVSEINTTPLIDVMLVLLVMLLITLPPERHAINLDTPIPPPPDAPPPPPSDIEPIRIQIEQSGVIMWMGEQVSRNELNSRLKNRRPACRAGRDPHRAEPSRTIWRHCARDGRCAA